MSGSSTTTSGATIADARSSIGSLPPAGNPYTPAGSSAYGRTSTSPGGSPATSYPSTGAAPAASDSGTPPYQPGSTRTGSYSPQSINSLSSAPATGASGTSNAGVISTSFDAPDTRYR
jgi:hypothetical protein